MAQSLCKIYVHLIFHVKYNSPIIKECDIERVHRYMAKLVNTTGAVCLCIGGISNHVHILLLLSSAVMLSHVVEEVKRNSSRWIKTIDAHYKMFAWQHGYAAFSVSQSVVEKTREYIMHQQEHHQKKSFREEYIEFLQAYHIDYDERYVFSD